MKTLPILAAGLLLAVAFSAVHAAPITVTYVDGPQDTLSVPENVEELGLGFSTEERITSADGGATEYRPCQEQDDDLNIPNVVVDITNASARDFGKLWYVADGDPVGAPRETTLQNYDGWVNGGYAFLIDDVGLNQPLIAESIQADGVFQDQETWTFVIQDYQNTRGLGPEQLGSWASVGDDSVGDDLSSGSIIAIPEPATVLLLAAGAAALIRRRRVGGC
jgi:hypothetical protein